jgi:N-glycosylase/DNA lyase
MSIAIMDTPPVVFIYITTLYKVKSVSSHVRICRGRRKFCSLNVPVVYDGFAVAIKEREAFQQPQKCAGVSRGRRSRPRRTEAKAL